MVEVQESHAEYRLFVAIVCVYVVYTMRILS